MPIDEYNRQLLPESKSTRWVAQPGQSQLCHDHVAVYFSQALALYFLQSAFIIFQSAFIIFQSTFIIFQSAFIFFQSAFIIFQIALFNFSKGKQALILFWMQASAYFLFF